MKKLLAILLSASICFSIVGCGTENPNNSNTPQPNSADSITESDFLQEENKPAVKDYDPVLNNWPELFNISPPAYSLTEIQNMVNADLTLDEVADAIYTLSDLIQYLHQKEFGFDHGDIQFLADGYHWTVSRSAQTVFDRNAGNCGGCTNFVNYIFKGDFDQQGYIGESGNEGGHWYNYFKDGDRYFFFDLTQIVREGEYSPGSEIFAFSTPQEYSEFFIGLNHANIPDNAINYILFQFMVEHEGSHGAKGDKDVKTPIGSLYANILPEQLKDKTTILYVAEGMDGAVFVTAPEKDQWPAEAQ